MSMSWSNFLNCCASKSTSTRWSLWLRQPSNSTVIRFSMEHSNSMEYLSRYLDTLTRALRILYLPNISIRKALTETLNSVKLQWIFNCPAKTKSSYSPHLQLFSYHVPFLTDSLLKPSQYGGVLNLSGVSIGNEPFAERFTSFQHDDSPLQPVLHSEIVVLP